jgi:SAM-dependent methyltransferase
MTSVSIAPDGQTLVPNHQFLQLVLQISKVCNLCIESGAPVLDAGFGLGWLTTTLKFHGINAVGIEIGHDDVYLARSIVQSVLNLSPHELTETFVHGDVTNLINFPSNYFNLVMSNQVIEHVDEPMWACSEMYRVLAPGGILYLDCPEYRAPNEPHYCIPWIPFSNFELSSAWLEGFNRPLEGLSSFRYTSLSIVAGLLQSVGFHILECGIGQTTEVLEQQLNILRRYIDPNTRNSSDAYRAARRVLEDAISFDSAQVPVVICAMKA